MVHILFLSCRQNVKILVAIYILPLDRMFIRTHIAPQIFDVLLTMHLSIVLVINQLNAQILVL